MRYSRTLGKTLRDNSPDPKSSGESYLARGGFIRSAGQGLFSFLPLGQRVLEKISIIITEELELQGGQQVSLPFVTLYEYFQKSGRGDLKDEELVRIKDRTGRDLVLSPSHLEAMVELVKDSLCSYRDLPVLLYQFQGKFRDEERTHNGLLRAKEFLMCDAYSFHRSYENLNNFFPKMFATYKRIFKRCGVDVVDAESGVGSLGGERAYEFLMASELGDDVVISCDKCGYKANREVAMAVKGYGSGHPLPLSKVSTPECASITDLTGFFSCPPSAIGKSMVFATAKGLVMAVVRGDYEVSVEKLSRFLRIPVQRQASESEMLDQGLVPGYCSPLAMGEGLPLVVDDTVANSPNLIMGANELGFHYRNVNFGRDFETTFVGDIVRVKAENRCYQCGQPLSEIRSIELGNIFKLGDFYPKTLGLSFLSERNIKTYPHMASYGIGLGRLIGAIAEANHDDKGLIWPRTVSPYSFYLIPVGKDREVNEAAEKVHSFLGEEEVLFDDREESIGIKLKDADLVGIPLRVVVSKKHLETDEVELHRRRTGETWTVPISKIRDFKL